MTQKCNLWLSPLHHHGLELMPWPRLTTSDGLVSQASWLVQGGIVLGGVDVGDGIRTPGGLLGRHIALNGVAALMARGAKPVQLSSREIPRIVVWHR